MPRFDLVAPFTDRVAASRNHEQLLRVFGVTVPVALFVVWPVAGHVLLAV